MLSLVSLHYSNDGEMERCSCLDYSFSGLLYSGFHVDGQTRIYVYLFNDMQTSCMYKDICCHAKAIEGKMNGVILGCTHVCVCWWTREEQTIGDLCGSMVECDSKGLLGIKTAVHLYTWYHIPQLLFFCVGLRAFFATSKTEGRPQAVAYG